MTNEEIRQRVRDLLGVPAEASYAKLTDTQIDDYVYVAMLQLASEAMPATLFASDTQDMVTNQATYYTPEDANLLHFVSVKAGNISLKATSLHDLYQESPDWEDRAAATTQEYWYINSMVSDSANDMYGRHEIGVWPKPSAGVVNGLVVRYVKWPTALLDIADGLEIVEFPQWIQDPMAHYAAYRAGIRQKEEPDERVQQYKQIWDEAKQIYIVEQNDYHPFAMRRARGHALDTQPEVKR